jgi:hypothetical protein
MKNPFKPGSSLWRYFGSLSAENRALIFERFCWLERMKSSESVAGAGEEADEEKRWMNAMFSAMSAMKINE